MTYTVVGIGIQDARLSYDENSLEDAKYLAAKMKDNGVKSVMILDESGKAISSDEGYLNSKEHWRASYRRR